MSSPLIKILLLAAIVLFAVMAFRGSRRASYKLLWRVYGVLVAAAAVVTVLFPDSLTVIAEALGVGRGADLLLYVLVVTFMLTSVALFRRVGVLERRYIDLARTFALDRAEAPDDIAPDDSAA